MTHILVVDDDATVRFTLQEVLESDGHRVTAFERASEALESVDAADLVITDFAMPGMDGLEFLRRLQTERPQLPVVMITARGSERTAVEAMRAGAYDYLSKPFDIAELRAVANRAVEVVALRATSRHLAAERAVGHPIVGRSPAFTRVLDALSRVAARDVPVLIQGETGTGKELAASFLHAQSDRASRPLVRFNCAAIPADLAESELFGHEKGAFTGATSTHEGYFARADGGTLVLDELGELPLSIQPKLLRALQEGEVQRVGSSTVRKVDVRVVACTNTNLQRAVEDGSFRADLYYRVAVVEVEIPPLRERTTDIPDLIEAFVARYRERFGLADATLTPRLIDALCKRPWPGNVRQLDNTIARLLALSDGKGPIDLDALDEERPDTPATFHEQVAAFERQLLARAMDAEGGNQSAAARALGMSRVTLIDKLKRHGLFKRRR